jgi:solute carrier family 35 protein E1
LDDVRRLSPIAGCLAAGHLLSTVAPAYGTVAFTNVVKTAEPLFTCFFSALFLGPTFPLPVYLSLIPVIAGVCVATASEVSFSAVSLVSGLLSNVAFAMRAITAKAVMQGGAVGSNLTSQNLYGVRSPV